MPSIWMKSRSQSHSAIRLALCRSRQRYESLWTGGRQPSETSPVTLANLDLAHGQTARVFERQETRPAESIDLVVPAGDALAVVVE